MECKRDNDCTNEDMCSTGALIGMSKGAVEMVELGGVVTIKGIRNVGGLVGVQAVDIFEKVGVSDGLVEESMGGGSENIGGIVGDYAGWAPL